MPPVCRPVAASTDQFRLSQGAGADAGHPRARSRRGTRSTTDREEALTASPSLSPLAIPRRLQRSAWTQQGHHDNAPPNIGQAAQRPAATPTGGRPDTRRRGRARACGSCHHRPHHRRQGRHPDRHCADRLRGHSRPRAPFTPPTFRPAAKPWQDEAEEAGEDDRDRYEDIVKHRRTSVSA
jgi:hypothetical protein